MSNALVEKRRTTQDFRRSSDGALALGQSMKSTTKPDKNTQDLASKLESI
jgi:hypothetical protein